MIDHFRNRWFSQSTWPESRCSDVMASSAIRLSLRLPDERLRIERTTVACREALGAAGERMIQRLISAARAGGDQTAMTILQAKALRTV